MNEDGIEFFLLAMALVLADIMIESSVVSGSATET
jgi:hypothetical protein